MAFKRKTAGIPADRKVAVDTLELASLQGQLAAISKTQAVLELQLDGTIITANENYRRTVGYELAEIQGQHHDMFVAAADRTGGGSRQLSADDSRAGGPQAPSQPIPERRSANRPFTGKPAAPKRAVSRPQPAAGPVARPMAIANGNDADWREF